jgi:hypothetical protein
MLTREQEYFNARINAARSDEVKLQAMWYSRMSGECRWLAGEKEQFERRFENLSKIASLEKIPGNFTQPDQIT